MQNGLEVISRPINEAGIKGVRICFETAQWLSTDSNVKSYYHVHIQHDDYPDFNTGVGCNSLKGLKEKIEKLIIPELKELINKL